MGRARSPVIDRARRFCRGRSALTTGNGRHQHRSQVFLSPERGRRASHHAGFDVLVTNLMLGGHNRLHTNLTQLGSDVMMWSQRPPASLSL